jgi:uncharacterized protein (DUF362 family)
VHLVHRAGEEEAIPHGAPLREPCLTRRRFGALAAGGLATLALPRSTRAAPAEPLGLRPLGQAGGAVRAVAVAAVSRGAPGDATAGAVRAAAQAATDFAWLSRGDTVLVKPACNSPNVYPATTDPLALHAMVRLLRERGAGRVLVADMSGVQFVRFSPEHTRGSTRALMQANGLARAAEEAGAQVYAFEEAGWDGFFAEEPAARGSWRGPIWLPAVLREVDHVVLLPRTSRHLLAGSTLALKAAVGWWRHDTRLEYHRDAATFHEKTADAASVPTLVAKQRLVLTSATRVLSTFGPDDGHVSEPDSGLVFASTDALAHDMLSLAWLVESRRALPASLRSGPIDDPNSSTVAVNFANRIVTHMLGGLGQALRTEHLARYDLETLWDDRVLRRAFALAGGVPKVELVDADGSLAAELRQRLAAELALPA